ncbi:sugar transferase [Ligilactobacillus apodemi]|uniref:Galactofuranosyltransferase n=1 Tax=Ligilactobacillus apodemi DSM 16634 = JCM 16172 TaxID=1423724 RepID=A0A0R1U2A9_9LACO|nr:sugar transferase [Ligilactobacillus apodemi]KRL87468.1 galactofuranosyltransferase [Ligilactobacillus apodemi DSM 16634 = JCM 16172]
MGKYILTIEDLHKNNAGPKAKEDVLRFLKEEGYQDLPLKLKLDPEDHSLAAKLRKIYDTKVVIPRALKHIDADVIILQYPIYSTFLTSNIIKAIRKYTNAKLYFVIHDVETLRLFSDDENFVKAEREIFNSVDGLVDHNKKMHGWLKQQGITTPCVDLEIFDYYNPTELVETYQYDKSLVFAGNLSKSKFLLHEDFAKLHFDLELYGPNPAENYADNIKYRGVYPPDELPTHLKQNFGLVWDGNSITECDGIFGEYTKYNNPHKASLYLSSGLPIIVWKQAALADFVTERNVGFAVESLTEVERYLTQMPQEQYSVMKKNTLELAHELRQGKFVKVAVSKLEHAKDEQ